MTRYSSEELETKFKGSASIRISEKKSGKSKYAGDAGYWDGGRCDWGGAHNLKEDCQKLSKLFSGITELRNCRKELTTFNNQEEFEKSKQSLLGRVNEAINNLQMRTSNNSSIGGVCIIWADFDHFVSPVVNNFRKEIEMLKSDIKNVPYNEAKELQKLLSDERKLQKEIEENERKARNEPDENKRKQFIFLASQAKDKWKKLLERKKQLKTAHLGDNFNPDQHIDDFLKAVENKLNRPSRPTRTPNPNQSNQGSTGFGYSNGSNTNPQSTSYNTTNSNQNSTNPKNNQQLLIFAGITILIIFYFYTQKEEPNHYDYYY